MSKVSTLEKNRFSVFTNDMNKCIICNQPRQDINEIFMGRNRQNSMRYGLCIPMCRKCHEKYHKDRNMQLYFMEKAYNVFIELYSIKEFKNTFGYIKGLDLF